MPNKPISTEQKQIDVIIYRQLLPDGSKPYICTSYHYNIDMEYEKFPTLKELKDFYNIIETSKTGKKGWAVDLKGKRQEWEILTAKISNKYIV